MVMLVTPDGPGFMIRLHPRQKKSLSKSRLVQMLTLPLLYFFAGTYPKSRTNYMKLIKIDPIL